MKKHLLAFAVVALAAGGAFAQANDTIAKVKSSGVITMGVRDSSGGLSYTLGDGKYAGFHVDLCQRIVANLEKAVGMYQDLGSLGALAWAEATSAAAVGLSNCPPKITAQRANHPQPSERPPTTSESQCRSRSTRLAATATAIPIAAAMTNCRIGRLSDRPMISAAAA